MDSAALQEVDVMKRAAFVGRTRPRHLVAAIGLGSLWLLALAANAANGDAAADYSGSIPLQTSGPSAAHYRVDLPLAVYAGVRRADLADLRVVNGAGEFVPYAVIGGRERPGAEPARFSGPVFAIPAEAGKAADQVEVDVTQRADGSVVSVRTHAARPGATRSAARPAGYIVDFTKVESPVVAVRPVWKDLPDNFIGNARVEASDDLKTWRNVVTAPVVWLRQGDARVIEDRIEFAPQRVRYLRIGFSDGAPELSALEAEAPRERPEIPRMSVRATAASSAATAGAASGTAPGTAPAPPATKPGEYEYDFGVRAPIDRIRIVVPELNALAPVRLDSRPDPRSEWRPVVSTVAYRMLRDGRELASPPIPVAPNPSARWRAVVDQTSGGFGSKAPELEASWPQATLVFLARGAGPFTLLYGARDANPGALSIGILVPGYREGTEQSFPVAQPGAASGGLVQPSTIERMIDNATMGDPKKFGLWALLIAGVLVLGVMTWRLSRQMRAAPDARDPEA